jgi:hypothetical protein
MTKQTLMALNAGVGAFSGLFGIAAAANGRTFVAWCAAGLFALAVLEIAYCLPGRRRSA